MPSVNDILEFHFSPTDLQQSAQMIIPITLSSLIEHRIDKLNNITENVGANPFPVPPTNLIPQVLRKFKSSIQTINTAFDRRELRTLTYSLSYSETGLSAIFNNEKEINYALQLLSSNWRDSFLIGIIDCYLKNWETEKRTSLNRLADFIREKLKALLS